MPNQQPINSHSVSAVQWALLVTLFLIALFLRTSQLGDYGFWTDEQYHAIAAQSMLEDGKPNFPNGNHYVRGLPFTALVAASFELFGVSEWSGRLPSVVISMIFLLLSFFLTRPFFGTTTALLFFSFIALSPTIIEHSRMSRFYSLYQLSFFVGAWLFYKGFEYDWRKGTRQGFFVERFLAINIPLLFISSFLIIFACYFQGLSILFGISLLIYCAACLFISKNTLINKYILTIIAATTFLTLLYLFAPALFEFAQSLFTILLPWAQYNDYPTSFYRWYLQENYLSIVLLSQVGFILLYRHDKKLAIYLNALFLGALIVLSILAMKQHRYMLHILPFMFLLAAYGLNGIILLIHEKLAGSRSIKFATPAIILIFILSCNQCLVDAFKMPSTWRFIDWKAFFNQELDIKPTDIIVATNQNSLFYYFRAPDYYLNSSYLTFPNPTETWVTDKVIISEEDLLSILDTEKRIILLTSKSRFKDPFYITDELRRLISTRFTTTKNNQYPHILMMTSNPSNHQNASQ